jgi:phage shock protein C
MTKHRSTNTYRTPYRARDGMIFGVCKGIARYADVSTFWIRFAAVIAIMLTAFWPMLLIYILTAIIMKPEPIIEPENAEDWEFYQTYTSNRRIALQRLKEKFDGLERRTRQIENVVTSPKYSWERRLNS